MKNSSSNGGGDATYITSSYERQRSNDHVHMRSSIESSDHLRQSEIAREYAGFKFDKALDQQ